MLIPEKSSFFSAILFDMDGTLVNSEPLWLLCEKELMAGYGYSWTENDQANCLGGPLDRVGRYMYEMAGKVETPEFFTNSLISLMVNALEEGAELMDGAEELITLCEREKIPVALVSASPRILVDAVLRRIPSHQFHVSVSSDDVKKGKPDPEGYLAAAKLLDINIKEALILEDSLTGVTAASASGGWVVAIPHLVPIAQSARVRTIDSVRELTMDMLKALFEDLHVKR